MIARHIIGGLLKKVPGGRSRISPDKITVVDPDPTTHTFYQQLQVPMTLTEGPPIWTVQAIVVLAVKPDAFEKAVARVNTDQSVISVMAGVDTRRLRNALPQARYIVRAMPNLCSISQVGTTAWFGNKLTTEEETMVTSFLELFGTAIQVPNEEALTTASALCGSGPAYAARLAGALIDAGVRHGLSRKLATQLVYSTMAGTIEYLTDQKVHPRILAENVTSPGGITSKALLALDKGRFDATIHEAVTAAVTPILGNNPNETRAYKLFPS